MNSILSFHTGQPYGITANGCQGQWSICRPELLPGKDPNAAPAGGRTPSEWFDTANFTTAPSLTNGNVGLLSNYGPPTRNVDLSLFKTFSFTERWKVQFRAESFNIANTPQFGLPDQNRSDGNFGKITSTATGSERHVQFSLRLQF
jgi:hypothetical protein